MASSRTAIRKILARLSFITAFVYWIRRRRNELPTVFRHLSRRRRQRKLRKRSADGTIKVVFICQFIPAWSKNKQLYETLKQDDRFETMLLCIPNRISAHQLIDQNDLSNDVYEYYISHGYTDAVNALIGKNDWLDLSAYHPDYVIFNRNDRSMPEQYTYDSIASFAKICIIDYATALLKMEESLFNRSCIANTYCFFAEFNKKKEQFISWNRILCKLKLSKAIWCGIPAIENSLKARNEEAPAWLFSKHAFRMIYAPRWTTNPIWGGTSFFQYKDVFLDFLDNHPETDLLIRPHPLMFGNFIENNLMRADEVAAFEALCKSRPNLELDAEKEYLSTFWQSSVLITDFSSILIEYFVTEKPVIYLTFDETIDYSDIMRAMLRGCYIVHDRDELVKVIDMLIQGNDPLAEERKRICAEYLLGHENTSTSEIMKQLLIQDRMR